MIRETQQHHLFDPAVDRIETLFLDEHIRVIHKPCNLSFHSDDAQQGLVSQVRACYPDDTLFPIHRLDKITSGLMIFARSKESNSALSMMLERKQIEKYYLALTHRKPAKKQGSVIGDMQKGRRGSYLLLRQKTKPAITRFFSKRLAMGGCNYWLCLLKPETGKTHQLRVAMKSMGCPILGDQRYAHEASDRAYLHAYKMRFELYGKRYDLIDELFHGQHFQLVNERAVLGAFAKPERLAWPKKAFLLPFDHQSQSPSATILLNDQSTSG